MHPFITTELAIYDKDSRKVFSCESSLKFPRVNTEDIGKDMMQWSIDVAVTHCPSLLLGKAEGHLLHYGKNSVKFNTRTTPEGQPKH